MKIEGKETTVAQNQAAIVEFISTMAKFQEANYNIPKMSNKTRKRAPFKSPEQMILAKGKVMQGQPLPAEVRKMRAKECFMNASHLVMDNHHKGWQYAEGFAMDGLLPVLHAWAVDENAKEIDPTWPTPETTAYLGIVYDWQDYSKLMMKTGMFGVLGNDFRVVWEVLKHGGIPPMENIQIEKAQRKRARQDLEL